MIKLVFENKDKIVLVMQYASGGELYDYVSYKKALNDAEARRLFRQIATAIYYCHKVKNLGKTKYKNADNTNDIL